MTIQGNDFLKDKEVYCDKCEKNIKVSAGKVPLNVLRGHQIHCKGVQPQEDAEQEAPLRQGSREDAEPVRKERIPFGAPRQHFVAPENDGYVYRVFNDEWSKEPGRIQRAQAAGYEIVEGEGSQQPVGVNEGGTPIKGVLMRIPKELYDEDHAKKQGINDRIEEDIHGGTFQEKPGDNRYIPTEGIKSEVKLTP